MFPLEQGAFEMLLIGAIALIVVGPKDLPMLMRKVGQFTAKMRGLAAEFRASFDEMARQSELDDLRREVEALRTGVASGLTHDAAAVTDFSSSPYESQTHLPPGPSYPNAPGSPSPAANVSTALISPPEAANSPALTQLDEPPPEQADRILTSSAPGALVAQADAQAPASAQTTRMRRKSATAQPASASTPKARRSKPPASAAPLSDEGEG